MSALLAGLSSVLRNKAAAPFVFKINVYVPVLGTFIKPISQTVSDDEELEVYVASSVQNNGLPLGVGGLELDNVD